MATVILAWTKRWRTGPLVPRVALPPPPPRALVLGYGDVLLIVLAPPVLLVLVPLALYWPHRRLRDRVLAAVLAAGVAYLWYLAAAVVPGGALAVLGTYLTWLWGVVQTARADVTLALSPGYWLAAFASTWTVWLPIGALWGLLRIVADPTPVAPTAPLTEA